MVSSARVVTASMWVRRRLAALPLRPFPCQEATIVTPDELGPPAGEASPRQPRRGPLTPSERRIVAAWSAAPILLAALVLAPFVVLGQASVGELVVAALVYGGLVALATGFVAHDRMQGRQCPRCTGRNDRGAVECGTCGYDLEERPRWRCEERHEVTVEDGVCSCGRRLQRIAPPRGVGREVAAVIRAGGWMLAFLVAIGLVLQWIGN